MRESRTYGSVRGACDETHVPTATKGAISSRCLAASVGVAGASWRAARVEKSQGWSMTSGKGSALDARVTAINEGLNDPSQRFRTELVVNLAYGELSRLPSLAADLVNDRVRAIVAVGPPAVQAAKDATADIPIIAIDLESDPVASGWIRKPRSPRGAT